ncbi:MAG: ABC transporter permease [Promethearchaeota archaeon]
MSMLKYTIKRLIYTLVILFVVLFITFILTRLMPGSPFTSTPGQKFNWAAAKIKESELGLDKPLLVQFAYYIRNIFQGNWGASISISQGQPVWDLISYKFPVTFELAVLSTLLAAAIGIKAGVFSAVNRNNIKDTTVRFIALFGVSMPVFWLGLLLQYVFCIKLGWFPTIGYKTIYMDDPPHITYLRMLDSLLVGRFDLFIDTLWHMFLPVFSLTFVTLASITRQSRSSMLEVLELDYIRSARAKGCKEKDVINKHALRNALIPTVTIIGLNFGGVLGGAVLTETTFNLRGFGMLMIDAIIARDYFLINALVFLITLMFVIVNLLTDLSYAILDPRIRY